GAAAGHAAQAAEAAGHGAEHAEHIPFIVEKINHWLGPAVFDIQKVIMPPIYKALKIFGPQWPGEGKNYHEYTAPGYLPIPTNVVMFLFVFLIAVVVLYFRGGKLSVESRHKRQQTFEVGVEAIGSC